jgi:hypothetical protein
MADIFDTIDVSPPSKEKEDIFDRIETAALPDLPPVTAIETPQTYDALFYKTGKTKEQREALDRPLREAMQTPMVSPESVTKFFRGLPGGEYQQGPVSQGISSALSQAISGLSSPESIASLPAYIFPPTAVGLASEQGMEIPGQYEEAYRKYQQGDVKGAAESATEATLNAAMTAAILHGASRGIPSRAGLPETPPIEAPPVRAPPPVVPDPWVPPGAQPDLAAAIQRAGQTRMQEALNRPPPETMLPQPAEPIQGPAPEYDPMAAVRYQQQAMSEMQPLLAQEYLLKKNEQPIPKPLADAIKAGNEKLQKGYQPPPERRFVIPAAEEIPYAITEQSTGPLPQLEVRPSVGEETPLRGEPEGPPAAQGFEVPFGERKYAGTEPGAPVVPPEGKPQAPLTSTKNAIVDEERIARGLQPIAEDAGIAAPETMAKVEERFTQNPRAGQMLVEDLLEGRKTDISTVDEGTLVREKIDTQTARAIAGDRALDTNLSDGERAQARDEFNQHEAYSRKIDEATAKTGSMWSEMGRFRQQLFADDYSPVEIERRMRIAAKPDITPEEDAMIRKGAVTEAKKISDAQKKVDEIQNRMAIERSFNHLLKETREEAKVSRGKSITDFTGRKATEARARLAEKRGRLYTGIDPTVLRDHAIIGADYLARGIKSFDIWAGRMIDELGDQIRPYLNELWVRAKALHNASLKAMRTPEEIKAERYKTHLAKETAGVKAALERGDLAKRVREQRALSREEFKMRSNLQRLKHELNSRIAKAAYRNQTPWQKMGEHFVGAERFLGKLSSPDVLGKLGIAGAVRELGLAPVEAYYGTAVSKLFPRLAKGTRFGAGFKAVTRGEIAAKKALFTQGMKDAWENLKGKETGLDAMSGKYGMSPQFWYHYVGKVHAAIKAPIARAEFERSMAVLTDAAHRAGLDVTHPEVMQKIQDRALAEASRSRFQQNTRVSGFFKQLDRIPYAGRAGRFFAPVVKIPVNLFKELVNLNVGAPVGAVRIGHAYWRGIETLPLEQREAIIRQLVKGSIGSAAWLWGYYNRKKIRDFFERMPPYFAHTPIAMIMKESSNIGAMVEGTPEESKQGWKDLVHQAKTDIPFVWTLKDAFDALDSHSSKPAKQWLYNMTRSTVVPQLVQKVATYKDRPGTFPTNIVTEKPIYRRPESLAESIMVGIPGLRERVSETPLRRKKPLSLGRL